MRGEINFTYDNLIVAPWVVAGIHGVNISDLGEHQVIGVARDGKLIAGVIFGNYRAARYGGDIQVWIRGAGGLTPWADKNVLARLFSYPFRELGCARITAIIREGNVKSERFCRALGFKREGVSRRAFDGKTNALIYGMIEPDCKWIRMDRK